MLRSLSEPKLCVLKITFVLFFCFNAIVNGQNPLSGVILDNENHNPVTDATVYINGTTIGTSSGLDGSFSLNNVSFPCQLMVSRVGYDLKMMNIDNLPAEKLTILLKLKTIQLSEVKVTGISTRSQAVDKFRKVFLGTDDWGQKAMLLNDSVLIFNRYNDTVQINTDTVSSMIQFIDGTMFKKNDSITKVKISSVFSVKAKAPLIVDLPALGYKLYVDLVIFYMIESNGSTISKYLGYYYYKPYDYVSEGQERRFNKSRQDAYYNSREHFCSMLYRKELRQNGYLVEEYVTIDSTKHRQFVNLYDFISFKDNNEIQITGQNGKTYYIYDFFNYNNKPIDLTNKRFNFSSEAEFWQTNYANMYQKSSISFTSDTCTIRSDGTVPDFNVMFGGKMSNKKVGAMIPADYLIGN